MRCQESPSLSSRNCGTP
eukprot:CCRYP_013779-RA/>CCRYP_013779-RA protein AED:0.43 eAED:1.00 QI:0/-1/0/1/-1/0/1/0/17